MKIVNLIEDTPGTAGCHAEHGLSFYIETAHRKLLLDTGASDAFLDNAKRRGIDVTAVDTVIISHGHYDHAGGVLAFASCNPHAKIYIHRHAIGAFYNRKYDTPKYIGMDARIAALPCVTFLSGDMTLDDGITVFSGVHGTRLLPRGNRTLQKKCDVGFVPDTFDHEQYLAITEGDVRVLLSGCAHNGILNILDAYKARFGTLPTHVISGFHTVKADYTEEDDRIITETAAALAAMPTVFYTGHCTGDSALSILQSVMTTNLHILHSGDTVL